MNDQAAQVNALFLSAYDALCRFAVRAYGPGGLPLVHDTYLIARDRASQVLASPSPRGWLFCTLRRVAWADYRRRQREALRQVSLADTPDIPLPLSPLLEYEGAVSRADLQLLVWVLCEKRSHSEVAEQLHLDVEAVHKRVQRAKGRFRRAYGSL